MFSLIFLAVIVVYFFKFHSQVLHKLGLSQRDDSLIAIGLFVALVVRNAAILLETLLSTGTLLVAELLIVLIFLFLIKNRYNSL